MSLLVEVEVEEEVAAPPSFSFSTLPPTAVAAAADADASAASSSAAAFGVPSGVPGPLPDVRIAVVVPSPALRRSSELPRLPEEEAAAALAGEGEASRVDCPSAPSTTDAANFFFSSLLLLPPPSVTFPSVRAMAAIMVMR